MKKENGEMEEEREEEGRLLAARSGMKKYASMGLTAFLVIAASILFFLLLDKINMVISGIKMILGILEPIVFGLIIAYIIHPMVNLFEKRLDKIVAKVIKKKTRADSMKRGLSIFLALAVWVTAIVVLGVMVLPELYINIRNMIISIPGQIEEVSSFLTDYMAGEGMDTELVRELTNKTLTFFNNWFKNDFWRDMNVLFGHLTTSVINFFGTTLNVIIGVIVAIYVLNGRRTFKRQAKQVIYAVFSRKNAHIFISTLKDSNRIFSGFIAGKLLDSLIIGILCFIALSVMKMPYTVLVSVIVGVTNVIPFFGPYLGAIPSAILILLSDPAKGLIFIVFIIILQQFDGNILGPKILGESTGLSAFWVVFSILLFGGLFGIAGMLFGVPVFAVIYRIISSAVDYRLRRKGMNRLADAGKDEKKEKNRTIKEN